MRPNDAYRGRNDEPFHPGQREFADRMRSRSWNTLFRENPVPMEDRPFRPLGDDKRGIWGLVKTMSLIILVCGLAIAVPAWLGTSYTERMATSTHTATTANDTEPAEEVPEDSDGTVAEFIEGFLPR